MLEINKLKVKSDQKKIIDEVSLKIKQGELHILMGPNGCGKSTLAKAIMSHPSFDIVSGNIKLNDKDITNLDPDEKAEAGLFLALQNSSEITGVPLSKFLYTTLKEINKEEISLNKVRSIVEKNAQRLGLNKNFTDRSINKDFSGGEKKKSELLQMLILDPDYVILDEIDSGLDFQSRKLVAEQISNFSKQKGVLLITHYTDILEWLDIDCVHLMKNGSIKTTEYKEQLAYEFQESGYEEF